MPITRKLRTLGALTASAAMAATMVLPATAYAAPAGEGTAVASAPCEGNELTLPGGGIIRDRAGDVAGKVRLFYNPANGNNCVSTTSYYGAPYTTKAGLKVQGAGTYYGSATNGIARVRHYARDKCIQVFGQITHAGAGGHTGGSYGWTGWIRCT